MAAFFDDFPQKAKSMAAAATEKARDVADSAKLTASILSEQRDLDKNYRAIGEWYVSTLIEDAPESVADLVAAARKSQNRIAELKEARQQIGGEGGKTCPLCGTVSEGKFCPQCGAPLGA